MMLCQKMIMVSCSGYTLFLDLLNDCFDQIDAFFDGQMDYDEDFIVEFLRSNDYNVEEAIDCIMENGYSKVPKEKVSAPKTNNPVSLPLKPAYTVPASMFVFFFPLKIR